MNKENQKNVIRADIATVLNAKTGIPLNESSDIVDVFFDDITKGLVNGKEVKIKGFGTFSKKAKKERIGRNPKTGVESKISARNVITFSASKIFKDELNS